MPRAAAITFKGTPMTLLGEELKEGQQALTLQSISSKVD